jgi:hypothetical protein
MERTMRISTQASTRRIPRSAFVLLVGLVVSLLCGMGIAAAARGNAAADNVQPDQPVTVTLGSGMAGAGTDLNTSLCIKPEVGGTPINSITSDPPLGSYTCGDPTPVNPTVVTATGDPWKYWGGSFGTGPGANPIAAGTRWVGVDSQGDEGPGPFVSTYIYDATFDLPCLPSPLTKGATPTLTGVMAADNAADAYLNGHQIATMPGGDPATNFANATTIPSSPIAPTDWVVGLNTIHFLVHDGGEVTGIDYSLAITIPSVDESCAVLKVCKVAGFGVAVGTPYTFGYKLPNGSGKVTVPAGPAPGGYCTVVGTPTPGSFTLSESIPDGDSVVSIGSVPSKGGKGDLAAGTFTGTLEPGVTEVTFTDEHVRSGQPTGYIEVCKNVKASHATPPSTFTFNVGGQNLTVPTGACSPAIETTAGPVIVTELPTAQYAMTGCATFPTVDLVSCSPAGHTATVNVAPGSVSAETILTVTNASISLPNMGTALVCSGHGSGTQACYDTATLTGADGGPTPTGTVGFAVCFSKNPTPCAAAISGGNALQPTTGVSAAAQSDQQLLPTGKRGWWCFASGYSGDSTYEPVIDDDTATQCVRGNSG